MILIDSYAQNYRWGMEAILNLTMPQIYMINGAAQTNRDRLDTKLARGRAKPTTTSRNDIVWQGKTLEQLNSAEYAAYFQAGQRAMQE